MHRMKTIRTLSHLLRAVHPATANAIRAELAEDIDGMDIAVYLDTHQRKDSHATKAEPPSSAGEIPGLGEGP